VEQREPHRPTVGPSRNDRCAEPEQQISGTQDPVVEPGGRVSSGVAEGLDGHHPVGEPLVRGPPTASQANAIASAESVRENRISSTINGLPNR